MGKGSRVLVALLVGLLAFVFLALPLRGGQWLHEVTETAIGKRPEFFYTWTLVATAQIASWLVSIIVQRKDLVRAAWKSGPAYFWTGLVLNVWTVGVGTIVPMLWPGFLDLFSPWRLEFRELFGDTTTHTLVVFVAVASLCGGAMVGIAVSQFGELLEPHLRFDDLVAILGRIKRSFLSLTIMLTLAVFSTARLHAAILLVDECKFSSELVLAYGLLLSLVIVIFYLPVVLRYHEVAEAFLEQKFPVDAYWDSSRHQQRELMRSALGLTALSGVESLVGALGPALGALLSLSKGK